MSDPWGWYDDRGWENQDDAHTVTFTLEAVEGEWFARPTGQDREVSE